MAAILETRGLTRTFGAVTAAAGLDVDLAENSVVGLIGGNGAGKTTFINLVTGYLKPTAGSIRFDGRDITALRPRQVTRLGLCRSFQIPQLFDTLTAWENVLVGLGVAARGPGAFRRAAEGARPGQAADEVLSRFHLETWRDAPASVMPEGVRKLLDIAMAMVVKPRLLLLDEPTSGVSSDEKFALMDLVLSAIQAERTTVLFVEHDMEIVRRYTERVLAFSDGRIIADGPPGQVLDDPSVRTYVVGLEDRRPGGAPC